MLPDTQVLLWAAGVPARVPDELRALIEDPRTEPVISAASVWEVAIKNGLGHENFRADPRIPRRVLFESGYSELAVTGAHAAVDLLPLIHRDSFDRILDAQAVAEGITLLTADAVVASSPGPIRVV